MRCRFWHDEGGAVTAEWVVITAAGIGLGLVTVASVATGTSSLAERIRDTLSSATVAGLTQGQMKLLAAFNFADGNFEGWSTTRTNSSEHLGTFLGNFAGNDAVVTYDVTLPDGAAEARIAFDFLVLDSWDADHPQWSRGRGDGIAMTVNGQEVAFELFAHQTRSASDPWGHTRSNTVTVGDTQFTTTMTLADQGSYFGNQWPDQVWRVEIDASAPPPGGFQLGLKSHTDQGRNDESFGIRDFTVSAR